MGRKVTTSIHLSNCLEDAGARAKGLLLTSGQRTAELLHEGFIHGKHLSGYSIDLSDAAVPGKI